jgi:riboflavin kinase/FMN adenylyltransferase
MKVYRSISERTKAPCAVTMGSFDGVHKGHQALIAKTVEAARKNNLAGLVLTYEPHPRAVLGDPAKVRLLTVLEEKLYLLERMGADETAVLNFDRGLTSMEPEEYVEKILVEELGTRHLVVGYDHRFGRARRGDTVLLEKLGKKCGFGVEVIEPVRSAAEIVKSSQVRELLTSGRFNDAVELLGHPFPIYGQKGRGHGRGKRLGYPTFNLEVGLYKLLPPAGIYAARAHFMGAFWDGMLYIGTSPTFGGSSQSVEINVFGEGAELGNEIMVLAESFVRPDEKFGSAEDLIAKMRTDEQRIKQYFAARGELAARRPKGGNAWL